ncbi:MAG: hypothetical protein IJD32_01220 [Bacteroidaceae bacterium]|nr:hypothetical protein [Bacteroidaceae bacterium]
MVFRSELPARHPLEYFLYRIKKHSNKVRSLITTLAVPRVSLTSESTTLHRSTVSDESPTVSLFVTGI